MLDSSLARAMSARCLLTISPGQIVPRLGAASPRRSVVMLHASPVFELWSCDALLTKFQ